MKIFSSVFLSLHVLMLCLTFIKKAEGFTIKVEFFEIHRVYSNPEKDGLPIPTPLSSPPPKYASFSDNDITENSDKTLSVSRPTLNPEEGELLLHTTPLQDVETLEIEQIVHILGDIKSNNESYEHNGTDIENNSEDEIRDDLADIMPRNHTYDFTDQISLSIDEDAENDTDGVPAETSTLFFFNDPGNDSQINNNTLDSYGVNKTEYLSLRIFRKMFDPRRVNLVYFFGGVAVVMSIAGALLLTKKLLHRTE